MEWEIPTVFVLVKVRNGLFMWIVLDAAAIGNTGVTRNCFAAVVTAVVVTAVVVVVVTLQ